MQQLSPKLAPLSTASRIRYFGQFAFAADPTPKDPERIKLLDSWSRDNLIKVVLPPVLARAQGADVAWFHRLVAPRFLELVAAWEAAGVAGDVVHWGGAHCARFIRGSRTTLSAHSWGSAFDINVPYNRLGADPTPEGEVGSVLRLIPLAEKHGFYSGGRFPRKDFMHFEMAKI